MLSQPRFRNNSVRPRLLWVGLVTYCLILLNSLRYVQGSPLYLVALGFLVNGSIILLLVVELKKTYKRFKEEKNLRSR
jgi:hypothetical protein